MEIAHVAEVCHEANCVLQHYNGDTIAAPWDTLPEDQKERVINGVALRLKNPDSDPEFMHENWLRDMTADGYVLGDQIDHENKTHSCLKKYDDLPLNQRVKDTLFGAIVDSLRECVT